MKTKASLLPPLALVFVFALACQSQTEPSILSRVHDLQQTARKASSGALGCGAGSYILVEINGDSRRVESGLDPIITFGHEIRVADIIYILESRVKSHSESTPMSGPDFGSLLYISLSILDESQDTGWVPLVKRLRQDPDPDETARRWARIILVRKAKKDASVRPMLRDMTFTWDEFTDAVEIPEHEWPQTPVPDWINVGPKPPPYTGET